MWNSRPSPEGRNSFGLIALAVFSVLAAAGLWFVSTNGSGGVVKLGKDGVEIEVSSESDFSEILSSALQKEPEAVASLLNGQGYYLVKQDAGWVDELRDADVSDEVSRKLRKLLFDLSGPFALPHTFDQAKAEMIRALKTLDDMAESTAPDSGGVANALLTEIWRHNLERTSIFARRNFRAEVTLLHGVEASPDDGRAVVFACRGSELRDKDLFITRRNETGGFFLLSARVSVDPIRTPCQRNARTLEELIANESARFWMPEQGFRQLVGPLAEGTTLPPRVSVSFEVLPRDLTVASSVQ